MSYTGSRTLRRARVLRVQASDAWVQAFDTRNFGTIVWRARLSLDKLILFLYNGYSIEVLYFDWLGLYVQAEQRGSFTIRKVVRTS